MSGKAYRYEYTTCRHCQGIGCIHCNHRGQFRRRVSRRMDQAAARVLAHLRGADVELPRSVVSS